MTKYYSTSNVINQDDGKPMPNVRTIKASKLFEDLIDTPIVVTAGSTILTDAFEVAGYDYIFVRLQGNATSWRVEYRCLYDPSEPGNLGVQNSMRAPRDFTNNSNASQGHLAVSSPYARLAIINQGDKDAQLNVLKVFCQ